MEKGHISRDDARRIVELFPEQMPLPIADDVPEGQTALEE